VPFLLIDAGQPVRLRPDGTLADVAPTVADLLQIAVTPTMTGATLRRTA
jgi:bisphosphoglycerate-independent phosphoglycerate mutase (AlkP superfamily)